MKYILIHLIHLCVIHIAIVFGSVELISQCNNILDPLNATVVLMQIVYDSYECNSSL